MLDEFEASAPNAAPKEKAAPEAGASLDEEWAKQLQAGMADLLSDMGDNDEMQAQFNALAKELNDAMASGTPEPSTAPKTGSSSQSKPAPAAAPDANDFQAQIKAAMDRMKNSETNVNAAVQDAESDDFLAEILKQMQSGAGAGSDEDFSGMLVNMMEQLTSKEILYEPMKELSDKYPEWLAKNSGKEKEEDMKRYREQYTVVKEIVDKFEERTYKDDNEADREYIVERMQKMQSAGAPPTELMGDVPPELSLPDDVDPDCGVQ
ncbi:Pex19 protein [Ascodesmis nigricans]|uniref:Pex19 protein n=1 Tax=Ascodesmis nigricans TaxID=341454 RepID=A0A4S2MV17_9PEZI|nr:Pex19 protein [Ascodesmis nigricans]